MLSSVPSALARMGIHMQKRGIFLYNSMGVSLGYILFCGSSINSIISFGVQFKALHNLSNVRAVIFLLCFKASKIRLFIPKFNNLYWEIFFCFIVSHAGL